MAHAMCVGDDLTAWATSLEAYQRGIVGERIDGEGRRYR